MKSNLTGTPSIPNLCLSDSKEWECLAELLWLCRWHGATNMPTTRKPKSHEQRTQARLKLSDPSLVFTRIFQYHSLRRINCQKRERIELKVSFSCVMFAKSTHLFAGTTNWPFSRHRQSRCGGKLHWDDSRK